jgi:hypothetical protein
VTARGRITFIHAFVVGALACGTAACEEEGHEVNLTMTARWNADPGSVTQIGFGFDIFVGWPGRWSSCFSLPPELRVTVNDQAASPIVVADCEEAARVQAGPVGAADAITVRLSDGAKLSGEAVYDGLLDRLAVGLVAPSNGRPRAGEEVAISLPPGQILLQDAASVFYYWLDVPDSVPPFHTFATARLTTDSQSLLTTVPARTGRAAMIVNRGAREPERFEARTCRGFSSCRASVNREVWGPVMVEVVP